MGSSVIKAVEQPVAGRGVRAWVVLKFGGSSVSAKQRWENIAKLMLERMVTHQVMVVVSALSGVTDALQNLTQTVDAAARREHSQRIAARHRSFAASLGSTEPARLEAQLTRLQALCDDPRAPAKDFAWMAEVLASGELCSSALGAAFLNTLGVAVAWLDARDHLTASLAPSASPWARHLAVNCSVHPSLALAKELAAASPSYITQGFIARGLDGHTAILGRGGSDTSASYFGALLAAERVEIWTDVPGMFTANPRVVPKARLLKRLDYDEAQEIAATGAKVLHPRCLSPVRDVNVPLWIKDTQHPEMDGTVIGPSEAGAAPGIKALSWRKNITLVAMESLGMWQEVGFLADVFASFKRHGLSVDLIGSSETNVTVSLDPSQNLLDPDTLRVLCADLAQVCRVKVIAPCAAVTLVGRGMRRMLDRLGGMFAELGSERVHLLTQASNDLNLTFVVDEAGLEPLVVRLHDALLKAGMLGDPQTDDFGPSWLELGQRERTQLPPWWQTRRDELLALAQTDAPCYVLAREEVAKRAAALRQVKAIDRWHFALKANPNRAVLEILAQAGFGFECVSIGEVQRALEFVPAQRVLYTPNFAAQQEWRAVAALGVQLTVDSVHVLANWTDVLLDREVFLRVDLGEGRGHHDKVKTGGAKSKFGVGTDDLAACKRLAARAGARITGLHAHLGSGILDPNHWLEVGLRLLELAEDFPAVSVLDLGGGLGVPSLPGESALDLAALAQSLNRLKAQAPAFTLWMEPGRYLVAECGVLLARVTQTKHKSGVHFLGIETGMNSLLRPALYDARHETVNLTRLGAACTHRYDVVGPICESGDVLARQIRLPESFEGDVLLIAQAGAYGAVMSSNYNLRAPARELTL